MPMQPIRLSFDLPVSINQMYRRTRFTVVLSNEAMAWKTYAQVMAKRQYEYLEPLQGALGVTCRFIGSKLDIDNGAKLLLDSCNQIIWLDDKQIVELHLYVVNRKDPDPHVEMDVILIEERDR